MVRPKKCIGCYRPLESCVCITCIHICNISSQCPRPILMPLNGLIQCTIYKEDWVKVIKYGK